MDASKAIKYMLVDSGVTEAALARRVGLAPQNLNTRLKSPQNWRIDDLAMLAGAVGARLECKIVMQSGESVEITPNQKGAAPAPATAAAEQPRRKAPAHEQPAPKAEQRKPEPIRRLSMEELMALREQKLAVQNQEEQLRARETAEQPKDSITKTLPPTRTIDYSLDAIPPELLERMVRVMDSQDRAAARKSANSTEKNLPATGTTAEQQ